MMVMGRGLNMQAFDVVPLKRQASI